MRVERSSHSSIVKIEQCFSDGRIVSGEGQWSSQRAIRTAPRQDVEDFLAGSIQGLALQVGQSSQGILVDIRGSVAVCATAAATNSSNALTQSRSRCRIMEFSLVVRNK
jgi:hypothetical protein